MYEKSLAIFRYFLTRRKSDFVTKGVRRDFGNPGSQIPIETSGCLSSTALNSFFFSFFPNLIALGQTAENVDFFRHVKGTY